MPRKKQEPARPPAPPAIMSLFRMALSGNKQAEQRLKEVGDNATNPNSKYARGARAELRRRRDKAAREEANRRFEESKRQARRKKK